MKNKILSYIIIFIIFTGIFFAGSFVNGCDYFQKKTFTNDYDICGRYFEICIKGNSIKDAKSGVNLKNCDKFIESITINGKLTSFMSCATWAETNPKKAELFPKFNCYDAVYKYCKIKK